MCIYKEVDCRFSKDELDYLITLVNRELFRQIKFEEDHFNGEHVGSGVEDYKSLLNKLLDYYEEVK